MVCDRMFRNPNALTDAEARLVEVYAQNRGAPLARIAEIMGLKERAVAERARIVREKLGVKTLGEAIDARAA
jgi:hypothetical protein